MEILYDLTGVHSSFHDASTNHSRSHVRAVDVWVGAHRLSYYLDLSLP